MKNFIIVRIQNLYFKLEYFGPLFLRRGNPKEFSCPLTIGGWWKNVYAIMFCWKSVGRDHTILHSGDLNSFASFRIHFLRRRLVIKLYLTNCLTSDKIIIN